ncbi:hypothetical protein K491DRAFT_568065, partial [Lophiostoma macrostomum CBS 122681]
NSQQPVAVTQPKITAATLLSISDAEKGSLRDVLALLNSLFTRNRNQHRRSTWFKSLQQFRKQLGLLLDELDGKSGKTKEEKLTRRLVHWDESCIHHWYLHYTQLVAIGSFAMLGLVLMACVARVCKITGITDVYEQIRSDDMHMVMGMMDDGAVEEELGSLL